MTTDNTQTYITGVLYNGDAFPSDPTELFTLIDGKLREIVDLEYEYLNINRAENKFSNGTTREQLLIFMKDIVYAGNSYLSDTSSAALRTAIINVLNDIVNLTYTDVEVRSTRVTT